VIPPLIAPADCAYGTPVILESFGREPFDALRAAQPNGAGLSARQTAETPEGPGRARPIRLTDARRNT